MKTVKAAIRPQEDSSGIFWRLHIEREDGSGFSEAYDNKPSNDTIQGRCDWANNNKACNVVYEYLTIN
jgi:hypothetical protein